MRDEMFLVIRDLRVIILPWVVKQGIVDGHEIF